MGALVSAGFEVSATVSDKLLNNTSSNALNSSTVTASNGSVSVHNGDAGKGKQQRYDNASTGSGEAMPPMAGAGADLYSAAAIASSANELHHHHQILPNYMAEIHLRGGTKTEVSESHDSEYDTNYKNGAE